ncbi:MAG: MoaF N-terminal domain-containing protein [Rhodobacteraceae bacterium]|nr:MoaF N-terminal domain-containing protein [Paracoccaceae bacterium]
MTENKPEEWLNYEDFAAGIDTNRLPRTDALVGQKLAIALGNGRGFTLRFEAGDAVVAAENGASAREWCEVVLTAPDTYFIDLTFAARATEAETLIINTATRRVLSIRCRIRPAGEAPGEPRVAQDWVAGRLEGGELTGATPAPTRDLVGLRAFYTYSPNHVYEHTYLSSERYGWQNLRGVQRGHGDTDLATTFKFAENQYVFGFREFIIPVASVFFYNFDALRSTGKFLGETAEGAAQNSPAGAHIQKASMTYYPAGLEPV